MHSERLRARAGVFEWKFGTREGAERRPDCFLTGMRGLLPGSHLTLTKSRRKSWIKNAHG